MKKSVIVMLLAIAGIGITFFVTMDYWVTEKISDISIGTPDAADDSPGAIGAETGRLNASEAQDESAGSGSNSPKKPKRMFDFTVHEVAKFPFDEGSVYKWIARDGRIYIQDPYTQQILELDTNGILINKYGSKGGAPWEHEGIMSFEVKDGDLYTSDNTKMVIKRGKLGARKLQYHVKIKETFWDAALLKDDRYIVFMEDQNEHTGDFSFRVFDAAHEQFLGSTHFRELLKLDNSAEYLKIAYGGHFIRSESGHLLFVCSRAGIFLSFDDQGNVRYVTETIDQNPPPKVSEKKVGKFTMYVREPDLNTNYSSTASDKVLYILSLIRFKKANNLVVDQYEIDTGTYLGSIEIPNDEGSLPRDILIENYDRLWVLYESMNISIYDLEK